MRFGGAGVLLSVTLATLAAAQSCAAVEGLGKFERADGTEGADGATVSPSPSPNPTVAPGFVPPPEGGSPTPIEAGVDGEAGSPGNPNLALLGIASATSALPNYQPKQVNDGTVTTSWYAALGSCVAGTDAASYICGGEASVTPTWVVITLDQPRTVGRVKLFGNRDAPTGYDVLSGAIELFTADGKTAATVPFTTSRGAEPNGDVDQAFSVVGGVTVVRIQLLTAESDEPGIAEIEIYGG